jgi:hypothetical protein
VSERLRIGMQAHLLGFTSARELLDSNHYLGSHGARGRLTYEDTHGVIVFSSPSSRRLPSDWVELSRWCIVPGGTGSKQWASAVKWLRDRTDTTTVVSYSDPSVGHSGALYRACNWIWAPTWHVLRPPPTGGGIRGGKRQASKHRWVFLLRPDTRRSDILRLRDESLARRWPFATFREPAWRRGNPIVTPDIATRYKRWVLRDERDEEPDHV